MRYFRFALAAMVVVLGQTGCRTSTPGPRPDVLPMMPQSSERYQCGPSTLASVLAFHGASVPEKTISTAIYSPTARGVLISDLAWFAREQGFHAEVQTGSIDDLRRAMAERHPPIVLLDLGFAGVRVPHFTAITGLTDNEVLFLGNQRADEYISLKAFTRQWERAGNQFLVILPSATPSH